MAVIKIGGLDPSLTSFGMAKGLLDLKTGDFEPTGWDIVRTAKGKSGKKYVNEDDYQRAIALVEGSHKFLADCDVLAVELPSSGSKSAAGMKSNAICTAVLASLHIANRLRPVFIIRAQDAKEIVTGDRNATKAKMIAWMREEFSDEIDLPKPACVAEHIADAFAAIYAGVQTDAFKLLRLGKLG